MKKFVSSVSNLFDHCGSRHLSQLLALFVAITLTPSMLLGDVEDQFNGRDKVHDPTGVWLLNTPQGFVLNVFHKGGTLTGDFQGESAFDPTAVNPPMPPRNVIESPENGVWQMTGWNTFAVTFFTIEYQVQVNPLSDNPLSAPLFEFDKVQFTGRLTDSGNRMEITEELIKNFNPDGSLKVTFGPFHNIVHAIRLPLEVLPKSSDTLPIPPPPQ
jgi:hypothetical protein